MRRFSDVNVEFGHIYLNENYSPEHYRSISLAKDFTFDNRGLNISKSVLIDNYNAKEPVLSTSKYIKEIKEAFQEPDFVLYEDKVLPFADELLGQLKSGKLKRQYATYIAKYNHYPCSLLVASWNAARLGYIRVNEKDFLVANKSIEEFSARVILSILPTRFGSVEKRALDIIKEAEWYDEQLEGRVNHIFF
jgi:hypothetical protein